MVYNTRTDDGDGWRWGLPGCLTLLLSTTSLPVNDLYLSLGEIGPPGGQQVPACLKIRQVDVKTQTETPAVLLGHLQSP